MWSEHPPVRHQVFSQREGLNVFQTVAGFIFCLNLRAMATDIDSLGVTFSLRGISDMAASVLATDGSGLTGAGVASIDVIYLGCVFRIWLAAS